MSHPPLSLRLEAGDLLGRLKGGLQGGAVVLCQHADAPPAANFINDPPKSIYIYPYEKLGR